MDSVQFRCDGSAPGTPLPHFWEHTVGSCHAPLALRRDWQDHLRRCRDELGFRHVRFHGLLGDDMSTLVGDQDRLLYSFFNADGIIDFLRSIEMRPFVELSFMPGPLASGPETVFRYRGNITPPKDYQQWAALIKRLAGHWVERYGLDEVRQWPFEVWNEPNLKEFWAGSQQEYFELYRHTAAALKEVDARLAVGGPATAKEEWIEAFLEFCERQRLSADFVSTHHYPNDVLWYEGQDTETQLANSRRGILAEWTRRAHRRAAGRPLYYTEWNCSSNCHYGPQDEPYAAAFAVKTVLEAAGLVGCYSFWTFTDIFEEHYMPSLPFHGGFGLLTLHGVPKPVYRAFQLLHRLGEEMLPVEGRHATADAWVVRRPGGATAIFTNCQLPRHPIGPVHVRLQLTGVPPPGTVVVERIDEDHANPKRTWREMGQPEYLGPREVGRLEEASRLRREPLPWQPQGGAVGVEVTLPPHAVAAISFDCNPGA
jgi:xylan 1,4-beta-xylosidase